MLNSPCSILKRIVPTKEVKRTKFGSGTRQRKKQMKEYADKRTNSGERSTVIGDTVLLKESKPDTLTAPYDPSPYSVIGVKGGERSKPGTRLIAKYLRMQGSETACRTRTKMAHLWSTNGRYQDSHM